MATANHHITSTGWDWVESNNDSEHWAIGVFFFLYSWKCQELRIFLPGGPVFFEWIDLEMAFFYCNTFRSPSCN